MILTKREAQVLKELNEFGGTKGYRILGKQLGVTPIRIKQIRNQIRAKLAKI